MSGDRVNVRGYKDTGGILVANSVERKDADDEDEYGVEGAVASIVTHVSFAVMGMTVAVGTDTQYELGNDASAEQFFAGLLEGGNIEVEGTLLASNTLLASEVELKKDDGRDEFGGERDGHHDDVEEDDAEEQDEIEDEDEDDEEGDSDSDEDETEERNG